MASDDNDSKWGTIFLDSTRESTLSKLDAMQAASRQQQWNQRTQQDYLEKVRAKAVERAREILGEAYTERQKVLEEAEAEANAIRAEAQSIKANAEAIRNEAKELRHGVQAELDRAKHTHDTAQEDGFQAGLEQAQDELEKFRQTMGSSVAGVLKAIENQSLNVFAHWRNELVSLLKVCVEKSTGLALDERYNQILEQLVIEAVRHLDDRRHVTLRVHPDDEPVMGDIFSAAKERLPDLGQWAIESDPNLEVGGLVAESNSGTVDSRLELFGEMVSNILEHLSLPESVIDEAGSEFVKTIARLEMENIAHMVPKMEDIAQSAEDTAVVQNTQDFAENSPLPEIPEAIVESTDNIIDPLQDQLVAQDDFIENLQTASVPEVRPETIVDVPFEPEQNLMPSPEQGVGSLAETLPEILPDVLPEQLEEFGDVTEEKSPKPKVKTFSKSNATAQEQNEVNDAEQIVSNELLPNDFSELEQEPEIISEVTTPQNLSRLELEEELLPIPADDLEDNTVDYLDVAENKGKEG